MRERERERERKRATSGTRETNNTNLPFFFFLASGREAALLLQLLSPEQAHTPKRRMHIFSTTFVKTKKEIGRIKQKWKKTRRKGALSLSLCLSCTFFFFFFCFRKTKKENHSAAAFSSAFSLALLAASSATALSRHSLGGGGPFFPSGTLIITAGESAEGPSPNAASTR